jgi:hypothetical protein
VDEPTEEQLKAEAFLGAVEDDDITWFISPRWLRARAQARSDASSSASTEPPAPRAEPDAPGAT